MRIACTCQGPCTFSCECFRACISCSETCGCACKDLNSVKLPKTMVKASGIPSAGLGLFAREAISKGHLIGLMEGKVVRHYGLNSFEMFDLSQEHSLRCDKKGVYYINEQLDKHANACFRYIEGPSRREVAAFAKRDIEEGEEITAQYTSPDNQPCCVTTANIGDFVLVKPDPDDNELWVAQVVDKRDDEYDVNWLLQKQDLHYIPDRFGPNLRKQMRAGELLMTRGWPDSFTENYIVQKVFVRKGRPEEQII
ncbi:hypothetical protein CC78DRAFT_621921 [Lojkania enalia]|uniref:SET domain-containing protein n=1 Tax=Lojkania enalia TaxID=147567 RepID=A0A9P4K1B7_9PLEO|nr:hypothetical protein CC78DRAFT_621921 [Didymosphaeria enalia]